MTSPLDLPLRAGPPNTKKKRKCIHKQNVTEILLGMRATYEPKPISIPSQLLENLNEIFPIGVYPQSDGSLATVDIDASKGFMDLWVHLSFAIFAIFDVKRELKLLELACDQVQTCLIFPLRWSKCSVGTLIFDVFG